MIITRLQSRRHTRSVNRKSYKKYSAKNTKKRNKHNKRTRRTINNKLPNNICTKKCLINFINSKKKLINIEQKCKTFRNYSKMLFNCISFVKKYILFSQNL
jgi:hypothetical protein